jgi:LUD domain
MTDKTDPTNEQEMIYKAYRIKLIQDVIANLEKRNMTGYLTETITEAREKTLSLIPDGASVSQGGSMTLEQTGIRGALIESNRFHFLDPYAPDLSSEERYNRRLQCLQTNTFVCSTNALTRDGILVNRDGIGNRVAAMAFGPGKVIIVAGVNKIVMDVDAAMERIDSLAAPLNCIRLKRNTPCKTSLSCIDCRTQDRICSVTSIIDWQWTKDRISVVLVSEDLGY